MTYAVAAAQGIAECPVCDSVFDALTTLSVGDATSGQDDAARDTVSSVGDREVYRMASALPAAKPWKPEIAESVALAEPPAGLKGRGARFLSGLTGLALRNILRYRRRSIIALGAIGAGVIALLLAGGFIEWILQAMREGAIRSHYGHVQVVREGFLERGAADPLAYLLPETADLVASLSADAGVETVAPRLYLSGLASFGETSISFIGQGVDPAREKGLRDTINIRRGEKLVAGRTHQAVIGAGLAKSLGIDVGDSLVLLTSISGINAAEVEVVGIFYTASKAFDDVALRVPIELARELLRIEGSHSWLVLLDDTHATDAVLARVKAAIAQSGAPYEAVPWYEVADFYNKTEKLFSSQVNLVRGIIGVLILLSISNTMMMSVMERTREIGTLMALGYTRAKVRALFLREGFLLGSGGALAGLVLGVALAHLLSYVGIPMPPPPGMEVGFTAGIELTAALVASTLVIAVVFTTGAAAYPAWKASRLNIIDALRHNR